MSSSELDYSLARGHMVDSQIRPNKVTHAALLAAFRAVPRERYVIGDRAAVAYADEMVDLGGGRAMATPMVLARLLQAAQPVPGERALVIGAGSGYAASVLAACGVSVTALDDNERLLDIGRAVAPIGVRFVCGKLTAGWPASAPYDIILIEGSVEDLPEHLAAQLVPIRGRMVAVRMVDGVGQAVIGEAFDEHFGVTKLFDCVAPRLRAFSRAPQFVF